jgi:hypothetical protein
MSPDEEQTALEEALQGDLPSPETSTRLRRRLLAAGLAVGNGLAVGTATAAGATAPGVVAAVVGKGLALSWGVKLGALAVVAIPTVGLLVESSANPQLAAPPAHAAAQPDPLRATERSPERTTDTRVAPDLTSPESEPVSPARGALPNTKIMGNSLEATEAAARAPSQVEFSAPESAAATKAASTLAEETRLLDGAFAELTAGNRARAALLIAEHERRFPAGLLQKERERAKARHAEISRGQ